MTTDARIGLCANTPCCGPPQWQACRCGGEVTALLALDWRPEQTFPREQEEWKEGGMISAAFEDCRRCGGPNVIWSAESPLWNYVMRGNSINGLPRFGDLVCMPCFVRCAVEAGLPAHGWRLALVPEPDGLIYVTPSGRVWSEADFAWKEGG